ncbi:MULTISPECIES: DNA repair protein RadA [Nitrosomonas]|uniref:DNA repair protein RadA n=1 Tax=Nitrosomonas europaea (strain ATCC 19718 / CIP 103999 / KCTC 2705 / NBRC 14298) TaxID=228410 RepID=Q82TR6_NITEU|nr:MULTISPECIES: DNA repair protein RadA [Nitrosomonas]KXK35556.1 MAG: DNA repair protein RadA [Nitrosomonas europaea]CAD85719.1 sms: DNA repair protein RadA [Nitrosomonas europaea ATCC 19718]SDW73317.1 DNA replication and repair protein RadA [Nitrosomonas europaea]SET27812.1 DNA replication and repair protein RadA [Nitrosomonas europaea]SJZ83700.1 DNA replication and repair protein RadA [Nitrosomonas europaea]
MTRLKTLYVCNSCGGQTLKWQGQCPHCREWNTLTETVQEKNVLRFSPDSMQKQVLSLSEVETEDMPRFLTGMDEFDRVLGGGLVQGGVVLLGGDPGIGKSTLLLQALSRMSVHHRVLYVSGEESMQQVALRARRLSLDVARVDLLTEIRLEAIQSILAEHRPRIAIIDSIQTIYSETLQSAPGSVAQVRECAARLTRFAKTSGTCIVLVGHVTKDGALAGPRVLEHMVDTVLYFEGDTHSTFRLIRAFKNRFGAVNELGVFAMTEKGLREVGNPSALFLSHHSVRVAGTCVMVTQEGTRPLLVEIQALVDEAHAPSPRRLCVGLEQNRLAMLLAVLHRHAGIPCFDQDIFINAVGGVKITEPGADLAVMLAIVSSLKNRVLPEKTVIFGEIGLAGEVRPVQRGQERIKEAAKLGFTCAVIPKANQSRQAVKGIEIIAVERVEEAVSALF